MTHEISMFNEVVHPKIEDVEDVGGQLRRWTVGNQEVILGDCLAELRHLAASSVDVVVTSPPYNIGVAYRSYDDRRPREDYLAWLAEIGLEIKRVLKPDGSLFLNVGGTNTDRGSLWTSLLCSAISSRCRTTSPG